MRLDEDYPQINIVCSNGKKYKQGRSFISNTWTFIYSNRAYVFTYDDIQKIKQIINRKIEIRNLNINPIKIENFLTQPKTRQIKI